MDLCRRVVLFNTNSRMEIDVNVHEAIRSLPHYIRDQLSPSCQPVALISSNPASREQRNATRATGPKCRVKSRSTACFFGCDIGNGLGLRFSISVISVLSPTSRFPRSYKKTCSSSNGGSAPFRCIVWTKGSQCATPTRPSASQSAVPSSHAQSIQEVLLVLVNVRTEVGQGHSP